MIPKWNDPDRVQPLFSEFGAQLWCFRLGCQGLDIGYKVQARSLHQNVSYCPHPDLPSASNTVRAPEGLQLVVGVPQPN